jgi:hypothetical protein
MYRIKSFFCFGLAKAGIIIGWFGAVASIGWIIMALHFIDAINNGTKFRTNNNRQVSARLTIIGVGVDLAMSIIQFMVCVFLVLGARKV